MGSHSKSEMVRCPYCVKDGNFKVMTIQAGDDSYLCDSCGHTAFSSKPLFSCTCRKCVGMRAKSREHHSRLFSPSPEFQPTVGAAGQMLRPVDMPGRIKQK